MVCSLWRFPPSRFIFGRPPFAMLSRILEPEVMDSPADAADYDSMDHSAVNEVFVTDFLTAVMAASRNPAVTAAATNNSGAAEYANIDVRAERNLEVLDLGTGTAQIPVLLCSRQPDVRVWGVDLAASMLAPGTANVDRAGFSERIQLGFCDAKRLPFSDGRFAAVMSNSIVHHIPEPAKVLAEAVRVTASGGAIFVRDLARPPDEPTLHRLVDVYAAGANIYQRQLFADSLRAALTVAEMQTIVVSLGYAAADVRMSSDRHWTWSTRRQSGWRTVPAL